MIDSPAYERITDHNLECVGCGAHVSELCIQECPFGTGEFGPAVVLRLAVQHLVEHAAGGIVNIGAAVYAAAVDLIGDHDGPHVAAIAREVLSSFVIREFLLPNRAAPEIEDLVGRWRGSDIAWSMYAAACVYDGIESEFQDTALDFLEYDEDLRRR